MKDKELHFGKLLTFEMKYTLVFHIVDVYLLSKVSRGFISKGMMSCKQVNHGIQISENKYTDNGIDQYWLTIKLKFIVFSSRWVFVLKVAPNSCGFEEWFMQNSVQETTVRACSNLITSRKILLHSCVLNTRCHKP